MGNTMKGDVLASTFTDTGNPPSPTSRRIANVDILRGIVMVVMALDHVRDLWSSTPYRPEDISQTSVLLFFTRWITHFCAPVFVFLSGVSIYLYAKQKQNLKAVRQYLLTRGLLLVVLEIAVVTFLLQFTYQMILLQVIWVIGWSMVILSALLSVPRQYLLVLGCVIIAGHNLFPDLQPVTSSNVLPAILHNSPFVINIGNLPVLVAYTIFPWAAVMMVGYAVGHWFVQPIERQNPLLVKAGCILLVLFLGLRAMNVYGDQAPWQVQDRGFIYTVLSFLNVSKYPPSLLFLCLTIGVALLLVAIINQRSNKILNVVQVYGRVSFFYFLLHLGIIVAGAYVWTYIQFGRITNLAFMPQSLWPPDYEPSLLRTYVVWVAVVVILYFPCKWFGEYKAKNRSKWLSYI